MKYDEFISREMISNISKGRYNKGRVREIIDALCMIVAKRVEKAVFEYCWLFCLQTLHYEFGFGQKRLMRFFNESAKAVEAFDSGVFTTEDIRKALKEDAKFECSFDWGDEEEGDLIK